MFFRGHKDARRTTDSGSSDPELLLLDGLSGLYQTWYFERRAKEEVARCARYGHHFGLVLWEPRLLPGEALADEVISKAGQVISSGIRKTDLARRLRRLPRRRPRLRRAATGGGPPPERGRELGGCLRTPTPGSASSCSL